MSLKAFKITDQKALQYAECESVPPIMIICGPNGSGKTTLLDAIKRGSRERLLEPTDTQILYQPPHRAIRRQSVQRRWLGGQPQREEAARASQARRVLRALLRAQLGRAVMTCQAECRVMSSGRCLRVVDEEDA